MSTLFENKSVDLDAAINDPRKLTDLTKAEVFSISHKDAEQYRLAASRKRFSSLRNKVPMLQRLADELGTEEIESLEDLAPLLFSQTVYNSYPIGWLEKGDFQRMTKWLDKLTSVDLSGVDASGCELIEEWLELMKEQSPLELNYSATRGGKMSFMPREKSDWQHYLKQFLQIFQPFSSEREWSDLVKGEDKLPLFHPGPRRSGRPMSRLLDVYEEWFGNGLVKTSIDSMDADLMSISGRLQEAAKKGDKGKLAVNPKVAEMKDQILAMKADMQKMEDALINDMVENHQGQRVIMFGTRNHLFKVVERLEEKGVTGAYAPGSVFQYGGLWDNNVEPENWKARTQKALGLAPDAMMEAYGMSEVLNFFDRCEHNHYHLPASIVPFVLQPDSGDQKPRNGVQTGRFAFLDLMAESYWGGFVTGDKITINWDGDCSCGRKGIFIEGDIIPLSMDEGGDDKINCSGSTEAHNTAVEYILDL